jgi:Skp family chaperone for outer membrane proteins
MGEYATLLGIGLQTAIFLFGGVVMIIRNDISLKAFQKELAKMQQELQSLSQVITRQAVQDERLNEQSKRMSMLEQRLEDLRRGKGYVQDRLTETVDREY